MRESPQTLWEHFSALDSATEQSAAAAFEGVDKREFRRLLQANANSASLWAEFAFYDRFLVGLCGGVSSTICIGRMSGEMSGRRHAPSPQE
jgi:hypothetical protein